MKFTSARYPQLRVNVPGAASVRFTDGELETTDAKAVEVLKSLPAEYEVKADGSGAEDRQDGPPSKTATKAAWVDYAVEAHGADRAEADGLTKADLVELYGG